MLLNSDHVKMGLTNRTTPLPPMLSGGFRRTDTQSIPNHDTKLNLPFGELFTELKSSQRGFGTVG